MPGHALRILIVEDQFLIAKQLETIAAQAGHVIVGLAANGQQACDLVLSTEPDVVFVDISLGKGLRGLDVAHFIANHCTAHVLFTTANRRRLPDDYCGAIGVVEKPFTRAGLVSAINFVAACIRDERVPSLKPESLQLSPGYASRWLRHVA